MRLGAVVMIEVVTVLLGYEEVSEVGRVVDFESLSTLLGFGTESDV